MIHLLVDNTALSHIATLLNFSSVGPCISIAAPSYYMVEIGGSIKLVGASETKWEGQTRS